MIQFPTFLAIYEIGHGELKLRDEFYTGSSLMAVSAHAQKSGQNGSKPGQKLRLCTKPGSENLILYNVDARRTTVAVF